jgi:hypothetical protein
MLMLSFFIIPMLIFGIADLAPDIKGGGRKTAVVYMALATWALVLWICVLRDAPLKSPSDIITSIVKAILPPLG